MKSLAHAAIGLGMTLALAGGPAAASQVIVVKQYDATAPAPSDLIVTPDGRLYGLSGSYDGFATPLIDELDPPAGGQTAWTQKTIVTMPTLPAPYQPGTKAYPFSLLLDRFGRFFAGFRTVDRNGYDLGAWIYRFDPPASGGTTWSSHLILQKATVGGVLLADLVLQYVDSSGVLYGDGAGTGVLRIAPDPNHPGLYAAATISPVGLDPLIKNANGSFYGNGAGDLFRLQPPTAPQTAWIAKELFAPPQDLYELPQSVDRSLNVYAVGQFYDTSKGAVFRLSPPASGATYTLSVLSQFMPNEVPGALAEDRDGTLYVVAAAVTLAGSQASVYRLVPRPDGALPFNRTTLATLPQFNQVFVPGPLLTRYKPDGGLEFFGTLPGQNDYGMIYKITP